MTKPILRGEVTDPELLELYKIREAAWGQQDANKNTANHEALDILIRVHQCIVLRQKEIGDTAERLSVQKHYESQFKTGEEQKGEKP